jgi:threonine/homoserine/homoserine lactone efflux protein
VKWLGAAYLVWLGLRRIFGDDEEEAAVAGPKRLSRMYSQGVVVNVLNPKTALFFLAFLPQFVDPGRGSVPIQVLVLGLTFIALGLLSDGTYAVVSARVSRSLSRRRAATGARRWLPGLTLIALGVTAAFTGHRRPVSA